MSRFHHKIVMNKNLMAPQFVNWPGHDSAGASLDLSPAAVAQPPAPAQVQAQRLFEPIQEQSQAQSLSQLSFLTPPRSRPSSTSTFASLPLQWTETQGENQHLKKNEGPAPTSHEQNADEEEEELFFLDVPRGNLSRCESESSLPRPPMPRRHHSLRSVPYTIPKNDRSNCGPHDVVNQDHEVSLSLSRTKTGGFLSFKRKRPDSTLKSKLDFFEEENCHREDKELLGIHNSTNDKCGCPVTNILTGERTNPLSIRSVSLDSNSGMSKSAALPFRPMPMEKGPFSFSHLNNSDPINHHHHDSHPDLSIPSMEHECQEKGHEVPSLSFTRTPLSCHNPQVKKRRSRDDPTFVSPFAIGGISTSSHSNGNNRNDMDHFVNSPNGSNKNGTKFSSQFYNRPLLHAPTPVYPTQPLSAASSSLSPSSPSHCGIQGQDRKSVPSSAQGGRSANNNYSTRSAFQSWNSNPDVHNIHINTNSVVEASSNVTPSMSHQHKSQASATSMTTAARTSNFAAYAPLSSQESFNNKVDTMFNTPARGDDALTNNRGPLLDSKNKENASNGIDNENFESPDIKDIIQNNCTNLYVRGPPPLRRRQEGDRLRLMF